MLNQSRRFSWFVLLGLGLAAAAGACVRPSETADVPRHSQNNSYLFCFWNVENLFDDQENHRLNKADQEFDRWFATHPEILKQKLAHLSRALIELNGGIGPDILAIVEVESVRAADLLRQALNDRLPDKSLHYDHLLMKEIAGGRHIAPAILTRLPVHGNKTQVHGRQLRILEGHIVVNGHDLIVVASHWTSQLSDKTGAGRAKYADQIHGVFRAMYKSNPRVDFLVCGDCNDAPDTPAVTNHLHATGDMAAVRGAEEPLLLNLFADKDPNRFGTHYFGHRWFIFDQLFVSPGLLDNEGWSCDVDSARTVNTLSRPGDKLHRPWHFGGQHEKHERGYSDHFPVTVRLKVESN
jgi:endonuclease/exonuclease/phosphatase family metal-dependent hydrolase